MTDLDRLRTHARTIVEGEGAEIEDAALVEAVALSTMREEYRIYDLAAEEMPVSYQRHLRLARAALSTIRKHQAGE